MLEIISWVVGCNHAFPAGTTVSDPENTKTTKHDLTKENDEVRLRGRVYTFVSPQIVKVAAWVVRSSGAGGFG
jgi:hypothetical protein